MLYNHSSLKITQINELKSKTDMTPTLLVNEYKLLSKTVSWDPDMFLYLQYILIPSNTVNCLLQSEAPSSLCEL